MRITAPEAAPRTEEGLLLPNIGRLEFVDPRNLVVDEHNVREEETEPSPEMIDSVREGGVEHPLIGRPRPDGRIGVLAGQIRMLSAQAVAAECVAENREGDIRAVPVLVRDDLVGKDPETVAAAVTKSLKENRLRKEMTTGDVVKAAQQLAMLNLPPATRKRFARAAGLTDQELAAAPRVAALGKETLDQAGQYEFDLNQLADLSEVEDVPGAMEALVEAVHEDFRAGGKGQGNWKHAMASLRQEKRDLAEMAALREQWTAAGLTEVEDRYWYQPGDRHRSLAQLRDGQGNPIEVEEHNADCPGRAFAIRNRTTVEVVFACADWQEHGHKLPGSPTSGSTSAVKEGPGVAEVAKKNKAEAAAREVRKDFITTLVAGKLSDTAVALTQRVQTDMPYWYGHAMEPGSAGEIARFLGVTAPEPGLRVANFFAAVNARFRKARRATNTAFAQVAMAYEHNMRGKKHWYTPDGDMIDWLRFLSAEGYALSAIEKEMIANFEKAEKKKAAREKERAREAKEADERRKAEAEAKAAPATAGADRDESDQAPGEEAAQQPVADGGSQGEEAAESAE